MTQKTSLILKTSQVNFFSHVCLENMKLGIRDTTNCFFTFKGLTSDNIAIGDYGVLKENECISRVQTGKHS